MNQADISAEVRTGARRPWAWTVLASALWILGPGAACRPADEEARPPSEAPPRQSKAAADSTPSGEMASTATQGAAEAGEPVLWIDAPVFDWGITYRGQQIENTFVMENRGTALLVIEELKSHCGCTVTRADEIQKHLEPGETTRASILIDTSLLRGEVKKDTDVVCNASGENKLWMQGQVEDLWKVEPSSLPKVEVVRGSSLPQEPTRILLTPNLEKPFEIQAVAARNGFLVPTLKELEKSQRYEISLLTKDDGGEGDAFRTEVLETTTRVDGKVLSLCLQVSVVLKDRIEVTPSKSVYVHRNETSDMLREGKTVEKILHVQSLGGPGHSFRIREAVAKEGLFTMRVETVKPGKHYRLVVTLVKSPEKDQRFLKDSIELRTDDPLVPTLLIPAMAQF